VALLEDPDAIPSVKSWPVPVSLIVCGLPAALSEMVNVPLSAPPAVGWKVTLIEQFAPAARLDPQVLVSAKSPVAAMLVIASAAFPVLLSVTVCALEVDPTS
jgi:hypothetical protein